MQMREWSVVMSEEEGEGLKTGKIFLQRCKQVPDHRDAPGPSQKPLPGQTTHVGHIGVMDRKTEDPETVKERESYTHTNTQIQSESILET